jgi:Ca2+-binding EF-hand superfamily protein
MRTLQDLNGARIALPVGLVLASMDTDRDTRVSSAEIRDGAAESFQAGDTNADGYLRSIEFGDWSLTYLGSEYTTPGLLHFDNDMDGRVSRSEFITAFEKIQQRMDANRDGALARAELLVEVNGAGVDPEAIRAQMEAEIRGKMQGKVRDMCQRGGRGT